MYFKTLYYSMFLLFIVILSIGSVLQQLKEVLTVPGAA
jgi:hypothetical protein